MTPAQDQPTAPPSSTTAATSAHTNPWMITSAILLVVIAALLVVIAALIARGGTTMTSEDASTSGTTAAGAQSSAGGTSTGEAPPTHATSLTDPATLEIIRSEQHRDPADGQAIGAVDATVVMVLYSDFACPYCTLFAQEVEPHLRDLVDNGTLRIEWRDLAQITETSPLAAQAGLAAADQGKFWEFHDVVYAAADPQDHPAYDEAGLIAFAQQAGVPDIARFTEVMNSAETAEAVQASKNHAYSLSITGTPFMIIGDAVIAGYNDATYIRNTVLDQAVLAGAN